MAVQAQVELDAIPAPVGGTVSVCAGSTVLFFNDTDADLLYGETEFTWLLDGDPLSAEGSGPVAEVFDVPGTYELTLQIVTLGGTDILDPATLTVEVSAFPDVVPTLGPGNSCTIESVDPLTGLTTFQTQSGASCTCTNASMGPAIALLNTDQYPEGTVSRIHWGGPGSAANGGTAPYTDEFGPFPTTTPDLAQFAGQTNPLGHYASQGSYNLIHEVIFPGGCVYTAYYVMSWGAAIIDLCGNSAQSVCVPLDYPLCFDSQDPGTTYHIDWGDGSEETFAYPNLPTAPNELTHSYPPSCTEIDGELVSQPYTLTITATNACNVLQTQNTQGPFYVSEAPVPQVSMSSSDDYCQYQEVTFTNSTTNTGTIASADGCSTEYTYSWFIVDTASIGAPIEGEDYVILEGFFGDWDDPQGSESITLEFDETGNYQVVLTASNLYCESQSAAVNIAIGETPVAVDTMLTICTGQGIEFTPEGPGVNLPDGTSLQWVLLETNPNITGAPQEGSSSDVVMELPTLENLTNALQSVTYQVTPLGPPPGLCLGHPFSVTVNVAPGITLPNSIDLTICSGDVAFLEPVNDPPDFILPDGTTFSWEYEDNDEVQGETAGEDSAFFEQELVLEGSLYEVVEYQVNASLGEVEGGCGNALFDIQVHVHDVHPGTTGPDSTLCFGADAYEIGFEPDGLPAVGGTMTIDWYASDSPSGPWTFVGSGNTYLPPSPVVEATYYQAFVTSELNDVTCTGFSSITSVELNVLEEISIGTNDTICAGDIPAEIALLGATDASWTYQWQNRPLDQETWSDLEDSTEASVQPGPLSEDTEFRLLVMNEEGGITCPSVTNAVTIEVNSVVPGVLSSTQYLCEGQEPAALQVDSALGDGELTYVWVPSDGSDGVAAGSTYTPQVPSTNISYAVEVTSTLGGTACSAATDSIHLLLNRVSAGVPSDSVLMHCVGDDPGPLVFDEPPSADGELGLQWQVMDASGEWTNVPGATDLGFDPSDALLEELQFRVVATSDLDGVVCSDTSAVWQLLLNQVDGGSLLTDQSICAGGIPSPITSAGNLLAEYSATYAWVSAEDEEGPWVNVNEGPETPIFEPDALSADTWFALVVISTSGQVACRDTSDAVAIEVVPQPELYATSALSDTACVADVSDLDGLHDPFSVAYDFGTGDPTYTWYDADWQPIQSDTDSTFMPASSLEVGTYNYLVSVELTGSGCQSDTLLDTLKYVVVGDPAVDSLLADASYCVGSTPLDLAVYVSGGHVEGVYEYAWYANGVDLEEGGATLTPDSSEVGDFYYYVEVAQAGAHCAVTSDSVLVEVEPGPTWTLQPEGVTVCAVAGSDVDLSVAFEGGAGDTTYTWYSSSAFDGSYEQVNPLVNSPVYAVSTEVPGLTYYYVELQLGGGCDAIVSDTVAVGVNDIYPGTLFDNDTICSGEIPMDLEVVDLDWLETLGWAENVNLEFNWLESSTSEGPFSSVPSNPDASVYNPGMLLDTMWFAVEVSSIWNESVCKDTTEVLEIVVNPLPVLSVIGDTICNNLIVEIPLAADFANTEMTYSWYAPTDEPDIDGEELTLQTLPVASGPELTDGPLENISSEPDSVTYSITGIVNATGCEGHTEATVLVMPDLTLDAATDTICSGGDVMLNLDDLVNVESTFEWYALPNAGIQDATTNSVSNPDTSPVIQDVLTNLTNGDQTQFYFVIPTSVVGECEASSGIQLEVEVLPPLAVEFAEFEANDTVAVCSGEPFSIALGASTSSGVLSWRARPNPLVSGQTLAWQNNSAVISEVIAHNQTDLQYVVYESKVLASGCLSPIDSIIVQVNPIPELQPLENLTFCDGVSTGGVAFSADVPGSNIHWSHSNAAIGLSSMGDAGDVPSWITQNTSDVPVTSMVDVAVNFENRGVICTGSTESFTVTVLPVPQVDPLGDLSLCELDVQPAIPLTTTVSGSEFQWSVSNGALGLTAGNSPSEISAFVASNPSMNVGYTTVTVTPIFPHPTPNASNCIGSSIAFQLEVFPAPQVLLDSDELCSGEAVAMDIATDLPSTWIWQANPLPEIQGETSSPAQSDSTIQDVLVNVTNSPVTVNYEVTPTSIAHGCVGQPAIFSALVNPLPQVDFVLLDQVLCDSVSASFENLSVGPLDFEWDFGGGDGIQQEDPTVLFPNIGVYDVTLVATNPMTGCVDSTQQSLEVFETPDPAFTWSDSSSCGPANVEFTATTFDASWDYLWDFGDGGTSDQIGVSGNLYAPGGCYDVSLTVTSPSGCTATQLVPELFCAFHQPNASFYPDPAVVTTLEPQVNFINQSAFATNYFWDFGDGYTSFDEEPVHAYLDHGVFQVTLNAAIPDGCSESATAQVTVKPTLQVYVPNAFTADMDGLDDSWCPLLSDASLVTKYQLWVYNRWGDLVFSSETPGERWLGAYDGGAHFVPNDVYTWVLALDVPPNVAFDCAGASALEGASSDCTLRGHVTILR